MNIFITLVCFILIFILWSSWSDNDVLNEDKVVYNNTYNYLLTILKNSKAAMVKEREAVKKLELSNHSIVMMPNDIRVSENNKGLVKSYTIISGKQLDRSQAEGALTMMNFDEDNNLYAQMCRPESIELMSQAGFFIKEQFFNQDRQFVKEYVFNSSICNAYLDCMNKNNSVTRCSSFIQKKEKTDVEIVNIVGSLNMINDYYYDVPTSVNCNSINNRSEEIICSDDLLLLMEELDTKAYVYAFENATSLDVDNKTLDYDWISNIRNQCKDNNCLYDVFKKHTNGSLGSTSPYYHFE